MRNLLSTPIATLILLGSSGCFLAIAIAWCLGENTTVTFFTQLCEWQQQSRWWLEVPQFSKPAYLFLPTIILLLAVRLIIALSPQPRTWSRAIIIGITLAITIRYLLWRSLSTLNLSNPVDGTFSLLLLLMELMVIVSGIITLFLGINYRERTKEADCYAQAVIEGRYLPEVDILIPTYNEPEFILKRTIIGCQALDYPYKNIYLLDDTNRPEIRVLAQALGCNYLTRPNNQYAKAGNLNHALTQTTGELVTVFDADFIPTTNFLARTVGFFQNPQVGLVQTPQNFYNVDPIAHNLGLEQQVVPEEEAFYRYIEGIKDGAGSVVCAGTSFVVRRKALEEVGYFVTDSISEDYFTGVRLSAQGYQVIYLQEKLSAGLAAESISTHIEQRLRWARGTLQAFFIGANPLTIPGLSWRQRLGHLEGLIHWFTTISSSFFLLVPIIYSLFDVLPLLTSGSELAYFFLPYILIQMNTFHWLNFRSRSMLFSNISGLMSCFPIALTVIKVILQPFQKGFKVTPKGIFRNSYHLNWKLVSPVLFIWIVTAACGVLNLTVAEAENNINLALLWSCYNLFMLTIVLIALVDVPKLDSSEWFSISSPVEVISNSRLLRGRGQKISQKGIAIKLQASSYIDINKLVKLFINECGLTLEGKIVKVKKERENLILRIKFTNLTLRQERNLIKLLYCRPQQWKSPTTPGELHSLWLLFKVLMRPLQFAYTKIARDLRLNYHELSFEKIDSKLSPISVKAEANVFEGRKTKIGV